MANLRSQPPSKELRSNLWHLNFDIFWFGILGGSIGSFLAVYATRIGATSNQIGLLTAGPAIVNILFTMPIGRWIEGKRLDRVAYVSSFLQRLGYVIIVILPWVQNIDVQIWIMILTIIIMSIPGTVLMVTFNALLADIVPPEWRAQAVGSRNALAAVSVTTTTLLCGLILDHLPYPINYQVVFGIGAFGAMMSSYHVGRIRTRIYEINSTKVVQRQKSSSRNKGWKSLLRPDLFKGSFGLFMMACLAFHTFIYFPIPIFPQYLVNDLNMSDGQISLGTGIFHFMMMLASLALMRVILKFGNRKVMLFGAYTIASYPLMIGLGKGAMAYYLASLVGGTVVAFLNGGFLNRLMERVHADDRPAQMAVNNLVMNVGILAGSLTGPVVGNAIGLQNTLLLAAFLRVLAGVFLHRWG